MRLHQGAPVPPQVLVVAGGQDNSYKPLSSVEVLEPGAAAWVAGPELPRWVVQWGVSGVAHCIFIRALKLCQIY